MEGEEDMKDINSEWCVVKFMGGDGDGDGDGDGGEVTGGGERWGEIWRTRREGRGLLSEA